MPRRRKHRKRGKNRGHINGSNAISNVTKSLEEQNASNPLVNACTTGYSTPVRGTEKRRDSFDMETPVRHIPLKEVFTEDKSTPVNKRRSLNRRNESTLNGTWNVTNLSMLFNADNTDAVGQSSNICSNAKIKVDNGGRSHSSIPKLHSPGEEKPLSFHKSTQTVAEDFPEPDKQGLITETPRVTQKMLEDIDMSKIKVPCQLNFPKNKLHQVTNPNKCSEININPYLKEKQQLISVDIIAQRAKWQKAGSNEELSFFSPQLYDAKSSSTPIEGLLNYLKEGAIKENLELISNSKLNLITNKIDGTPRREAVNKTPRSEMLREVFNNSVDLPGRQENLNINTPPLTHKVLEKDKTNSIKLLGSNKKRSGVSRIQNRTSPKINRLKSHSRLFTDDLSSPGISASRRASFDRSDELRSPIKRLGIQERMINRFKKYSVMSVKWSAKMMEACTQLGIQVKNRLTWLCNLYNENSALDCSQTSCNCEFYKSEIRNLNIKVADLSEQLMNLRRDDVEKIRGELNKVQQELFNVTDLRSEIASLKEQFQCFKNTAPSLPVPTAMFQPATPLPPPPPPPPPPPMPPIHRAPPKLALERRTRSVMGLGAADRSEIRPRITLDDILNVKLKKTSERPMTTPTCRPRVTSNSMAPDDLLRQVRLRTSHNKMLMTPNLASIATPSGVSSTSSELSTSPASSLTRLLESGSVRRVKRLRKVGGYSFDSLHRGFPVAASLSSSPGRRDRGGS